MNDERDADAFGEGVGMGVRASGRRRTVRCTWRRKLASMDFVLCTVPPIQQGHPRISYRLTLLETTLTS